MRCTCLAALLLALSGTAAAETLAALRVPDLVLISFDSATPGQITAELTLTGFPTGVKPVALDFRPENQSLVAAARGPDDDTCRLYTVNTATGAVSAQGASFACPADFSDIDFNPVSDRARFISTSSNFEVNPADGTVASDTAPTFATGDVNDNETPLVGGSAHDQNSAASTTTTLFAIEAGNDVLVRVGSVNANPIGPDSGQLTTIGELNLGAAVLPVEADTLFDVSPAGTAYLYAFDPVQNNVRGNLYTVNLTNGLTTVVGPVGGGGVDLRGLTAAPGLKLGQAAEDDDDIVFGGGCAGSLLALLGLAALRRRQRR